MAESFKVLLNGQYIGDANSVEDGRNLARMMANRMGLRGGNNKVEIFDSMGQRRGGGSIYVT